jgi:hypothetical protein
VGRLRVNQKPDSHLGDVEGFGFAFQDQITCPVDTEYVQTLGHGRVISGRIYITYRGSGHPRIVLMANGYWLNGQSAWPLSAAQKKQSEKQENDYNQRRVLFLSSSAARRCPIIFANGERSSISACHTDDPLDSFFAR